MCAMNPSISSPKRAMGLFIASSTALWLVAVAVSTSLAGKEGGPKNGAPRGSLQTEQGDEKVMISPESARLRKAVDADPKNRELLLQLAASLRSDAKVRPSPGLVMEAVQAYSRVLDLNRDDADGLLGLATVCFEADILDKSVEYYSRYLALRPNDLEAATDYSLALIQGGQMDRAVTYLTPIADAHPDRFQMRLTLAVAEKLRGNLEESRKHAGRALEKAPNDEAREHIHEFLASLDAPQRMPAIPPSVSPASLSPASLIEQYFSTHPIIGPKMKKIVWPDATNVEVRVKDFPVEQMPEFAKQKFLSSASTALKIMPEKITIRLVDDASGKMLLQLEAGGTT